MLKRKAPAFNPATASTSQTGHTGWRLWPLTTWLGWSLCLLSLVLTPWGLILEKLNTPFLDLLKIRVYPIQALIALVLPPVGALIVSHRPRNPLGWLLCVIGLMGAVAIVSRQYAVYTLVNNPGSLPAGPLVGWSYLWSWMLAFSLLPVLFLLFPDGRLLSPRWRPLLWLAVTGIGLLVLPIAFISWSLRGEKLLASKPNEMGSSLVLTFIAVGLLAVATLGAVISLILRFKRSRDEERLQMKWFTYAVVLLAVTTPLNFIALLTENNLFIDTTNALAYITFTGVPVAIGIAIMKYRLYNIDIIIHRTLVYGSLTLALALLYFTIVITLQALLRGLTGQSSELAVVASTLAVAALFQPLRRRFQSFIDRRFYRQKYDAARTLAAFSSTLQQELNLQELCERLSGVVNETMQPASVGLWLRQQENKLIEKEIN